MGSLLLLFFMFSKFPIWGVCTSISITISEYVGSLLYTDRETEIQKEGKEEQAEGGRDG